MMNLPLVKKRRIPAGIFFLIATLLSSWSLAQSVDEDDVDPGRALRSAGVPASNQLLPSNVYTRAAGEVRRVDAIKNLPIDLSWGLP